MGKIHPEACEIRQGQTVWFVMETLCAAHCGPQWEVSIRKLFVFADHVPDPQDGCEIAQWNRTLMRIFAAYNGQCLYWSRKRAFAAAARLRVVLSEERARLQAQIFLGGERERIRRKMQASGNQRKNDLHELGICL